MSYGWRLWIGFALVLAVLLTAMGWISVTAVRLDRAETVARQRAAIEENVRLALWRMDSALAPRLAQENAHPHYLADTPSPGDQPLQAGSDSSYVLLRFQYAADGSTVWLQQSWLPQLLREETPAGGGANRQADRLARRVPQRQLLAKLTIATAGSPESRRRHTDDASPRIASLPVDTSIQSRAAVEFQQRSESLKMNNALAQQLQIQQSPATDIPSVMLTPAWVSGEMFLARRVHRAGAEYVQGCLIDWTAMQHWLLDLVADLLPNARLVPLEEFDPAGETGLLAALPVRLLPGRISGELQPPHSTVPQMLALAWLAVLLSSTVGAVLVAGVVRLSQRRGAFVSAVTHELRTPLTTFRMYTEMLAQGMVRDVDAQREYLQTLRDESLRLSHLVENVLAYARLERGRGVSPPEDILLSQLVDPILPRLEQQAAAAQMELVVERAGAFGVLVRANQSAVEQILINLIDNACKYASGAADRRICISADRVGRCLALRVRDSGPGLPHQRKWFQPFGKSVQEAANSAPGVGLGLGLSRRLAEQMGGALDVDRTVTDGAALVLRLRIATGEAPR